ncbi:MULTISPECIES: class I SAM-dependent methyltransferase [unclassified Pseudomonas]|uniref:class I SAM-dependent methyltransferase n=1 Tax=unclassified Pseudomonas TaxID=196821 RepID=UPI000839AFAB|nr:MULTISPECIES: class I SAM-dependent methyltransferase [unclassified Pseudomonas]QIH08373.1 methyltransferase domain-containing protein [Pseudomonas sp. BIOMIG1BAC]
MNDRPIHHAAADGYKQAADTYARGRPGYPPELEPWLRQVLELQPGRVVVDLGAGTGKFTARLLATGAQVIAVEPVAQMRAKLAQQYPDAQVLDGSAEAIPLRDASVDVLACAQAFHWFASHQALDEIHRVLKPNGKLALVWNQRDARVPWVAHLERIVNALQGDTPRYYTGAWRQAFPHPGFGPLQEQHFSHGHTGPAQDVIFNRVRSTSFIAALPQDQRDALERQLAELVASEPQLRDSREVTVPYETAAFYAIKQA